MAASSSNQPSPPSPSKRSAGTLHKTFEKQATAVNTALDRLRNDTRLKDLSLTLPRIIVVGPESSGKSTVLERLIGLRVFPKADGICTRMPIELRLFHIAEDKLVAMCEENHTKYSSGQVFSRLGLQPAGSEEMSKTTPFMNFNTLLEKIRPFHDKLVADKNGALTGIISDVLVVELYGKVLQNLRLLDLPGIVHARLPGEPEDMADQTQKLVRRHLETPDTLVLVVGAATEGFRSSTAMGLIQRLNMTDKTVGVLTKADLTFDTREVYRDDPYHMLVRMLDPEATGGALLSNGIVALKNHDVTLSARLNVNPDLDKVTTDEEEWFREHLPARLMAEGKVGLQAVSNRLVALLTDYTKDVWMPKTLAAMRRRHEELEGLRKAIGLLPRPDQHEAFFSKLVVEISSSWGEFLDPRIWSELLSVPPELGNFLGSFQLKQPARGGEEQAGCLHLVNWRDFKREVQEQLRGFLFLWLQRVRDRVLVEGSERNYSRFVHIKETLEQQFLNFDGNAVHERCLHQLMTCVFDPLDAKPRKRSKAPERVVELLKTAIFECCLEKFERGLFQCAQDATILLQALLSAHDVAHYLTESEETIQKRQRIAEQLRALEEAFEVIQKTFSASTSSR